MNQVRVGIGVIVLRDGQILLGRRRGSHGAGSWAPPGGHLEYGETPEACAIRELAEETGLQALDIRRGPWVNDVMVADERHYVTLFMICAAAPGEAQRLEPDKCEGWSWQPLNALPQPLFQPLASLLANGLMPMES